MEGAQLQFNLPQTIGAPVAIRRLAEQPVICMPPNTQKFTLKQWALDNDMRRRINCDQQEIAERILSESQRLIDETKERTESAKLKSDKRIEERLLDVKFNKSELEIARRDICEELECLSMYKTRLQDCLASLEENALNICNKCLMLRDGRLGIDLVVDDVEEALRKEINTILGAKALLNKALEQVNEQMRRIRSNRYMVDKDLNLKCKAIQIDTENLALKPTHLCLSVYEGYNNLDPSTISVEEYLKYSTDVITKSHQEVNSARPLRAAVDVLIKQVTIDLRNAYEYCNHTFRERIKNTKIVKAKLEEMHHKTTDKVLKMQKAIEDLKRALLDKQGYVGLAHTRLGKRAQRQECELVHDSGAQSLLQECELLRLSVDQLQQMLLEANASLRYLLQTQLQLEEDINVKMNTLKIDEIDCMTLRATVEYHEY